MQCERFEAIEPLIVASGRAADGVRTATPGGCTNATGDLLRAPPQPTALPFVQPDDDLHRAQPIRGASVSDPEILVVPTTKLYYDGWLTCPLTFARNSA